MKLAIVMQEGNDIEYLVHNFPTKPWDWKALSMNPGITWEFILSHPFLPWDMSCMSSNPNIKFQAVYMGLDRLNWDWERLSGNPNMTYSMVKSTPNLPWKMDVVYDVAHATLEEYLAEPNKPWNMSMFSDSPDNTQNA